MLWEDLDHGEIARVLGCSRGAVHVRLHRARKRLARTLADAGVEVPPGRSGATAPLTEGRSL
ncbi:hypothetical protein NE236_06700 [Actinoallomurus purpureus]|uniref:RNA polymerase sigma factor n=1 Tax=Actinoallomurus purpureus TaxID=478114 RepID=UPI002091F357|nr:sigma factor-like helix-turn-helix DNA-binding protein [Actinoallomurus purpureus]MCO6004665.1 hypothetical protein [Actinoallomurus purpureus]